MAAEVAQVEVVLLEALEATEVEGEREGKAPEEQSNSGRPTWTCPTSTSIPFDPVQHWVDALYWEVTLTVLTRF